METQLGEAGRYCEAKGWAVSEEHVFIDDGISRAEFKKRPGLIFTAASISTSPFHRCGTTRAPYYVGAVVQGFGSPEIRAARSANAFRILIDTGFCTVSRTASAVARETSERSPEIMAI